MKKSTKGAIAAAAAGTLLLGGAGSLAYWTATGTANGGSITAGKLTLAGGTCGATWNYAAGAAKAGQAVVKFVPGDKITKQCTFTIGASGDNLSATISAPATVAVTTLPAGTSFSATVATTYKVGTAAIANGGLITSADDAKVVTTTFDVTIPYGTDEAAGTKINTNDTQSIVATLDALQVKLTQTNPNL